jgi:MASE9 protein
MTTKMPNRAKLFLGALIAAGLATGVYAVVGTHLAHSYQAVALLVMAVIASRLRLRLPGLTGNMSVNVPFILIAMVQLSLGEALLVAMASTLAQCFPKSGKPKAAQLLFNVSNAALAVGLGTGILRQIFTIAGAVIAPKAAALPLAVGVFFLAQTVPVATIISLTEGGKLAQIWSNIFHLSFPYYVLSAGVTSIVTAASQHVGWQIPLLVLPVMYGVYRSYAVYFGRSVADMSCQPMAKAASA